MTLTEKFPHFLVVVARQQQQQNFASEFVSPSPENVADSKKEKKNFFTILRVL